MTPKELRTLRAYTALMRKCITALDAQMALPSTVERGRAIAHLRNQMEYATEQIQYFTLDIDYRTQQPRKLTETTLRTRP